MITCEKCGELFNREEIETIRVNLRDKTQRPLDLCKVTCAPLWDETEPGDWAVIGGEEVQRLYWTCDQCGEVYRFDAVKVMVQLVQAPPRTEMIICEDCEKTLTQDGNPQQWTPAVAVQAEPEPAAQEPTTAPESEAEPATQEPTTVQEAEAEPATQEPEPASQEAVQAATFPRQSGWQIAIQTVQAMVETVIEMATETYRKIIKE